MLHLFFHSESQNRKGHVRTSLRRGTNPGVSELLNELLTRIYSDEGTPIGLVGTALYPILRNELREMLVREN